MVMSFKITDSRNIKSIESFHIIVIFKTRLISALVWIGVLLASIALSHCEEVDLSSIIPNDYDSRMRPMSQYGINSTLNISISMFLNELINVDDAQQNFEVDLIIVEEWQDPRLNVSNISGQISVSESSKIERFWLPDLLIVNGESASIVDAFQSVQKLTISEKGWLHYAFRVNAQMQCSLNLERYPHDSQYCYIFLSTFMYNRSEIVLNWKRFDVYNFEYSHFKIRIWYTNPSCLDWENQFSENSCIVATIKLVRHLSYYIIRYYLLTFLTVIISFVGFWLPPNAFPARTTFVVMPLLNLITQDISINNEIQVNYVTSFHWWMMWIQGIVYLEGVEYAVCLSWAHFVNDKKRVRKLAEEMKNNPSVATITPPILVGYYFGNKNWYTKCGAFFDRLVYFFFGSVDLHRDPYTRNKIDYVSRFLFPIVFIFFVLIYILATVAPWAANYN